MTICQATLDVPEREMGRPPTTRPRRYCTSPGGRQIRTGDTAGSAGTSRPWPGGGHGYGLADPAQARSQHVCVDPDRACPVPAGRRRSAILKITSFGTKIKSFPFASPFIILYDCYCSPMMNSTPETAARQASEDLVELQFTPIPAEEASEMDDRVYLLGVRCEAVR